ncbi:hypothetical protein EV580_4747 [Mycobacterium sp. BK086]|nr:hypothetical protein EV580_4747 [Mycobacterium sp. BK086]
MAMAARAKPAPPSGERLILLRAAAATGMVSQNTTGPSASEVTKATTASRFSGGDGGGAAPTTGTGETGCRIGEFIGGLTGIARGAPAV